MMGRPCSGGVAVLLWLTTAHAALAQTEADREFQQLAVVRVESMETGLPGAGLIIAVEGVDRERVRVLTARHVVEGDRVRRAEQGPGCDEIPGRRCCVSKPNVVFRTAQEKYPAVAAYCGVDLDVAILELSGVPKSIEKPPFRPPTRQNDQPGTPVSLFGVPGGDWSRVSDAMIARPPSGVRRIGPLIEISASGVGAGYSGGAVLDSQLGFVGMILKASAATAHALPASDVIDLLERWQVKTTQLPDTSTQRDNPSFARSGGPGYLGESARNAIRRYRTAFEGMDAVTLSKVFPGMPSVSALFGDAREIQFFLSNCSDISVEKLDVNPVISCEFDLTIVRRTGPAYYAASAGYATPDMKAGRCVAARGTSGNCLLSKLAFTLTRIPDDPFVWRVTKVGGAEKLPVDKPEDFRK
jgi:hypothetical protein